MDTPQSRRLIVYGLSDPATEEIRYIGKTCQRALVRVYDHVFDSKLRTRTHKEQWIRKLLRDGRRPEIFIIEELDATTKSLSDLDEAERFWIAYFKMIGASLTNATDGGEGWAIGDRNPMRNPEARAKFSVANKGRKLTAEHKARVLANLERHRQDPEYRQRMAAIMVTRNKSPEMRAKVKAANRSPEIKEKRSKAATTANLKRFRDPVQRERQAAMLAVRNRSPKMREMNRRRHEQRRLKKKNAQLALWLDEPWKP